ncbi:FAD-binding oxidoreductase [Herbaspirillum robiniae]|uniref:FAD-binding oxidoreductase n=1 Tax=Herbaspirillum robiniae TaxID=2014887 RepID=UPI003D7772A3
MTDHKVVLRFADGVEKSISIPHGGEVLHHALLNEIPLIHQCRAGSCGTCVCNVAKGDIRLEATTSVSLFPREIEQGQRLSCVTKAYSDGEIILPYSSAELLRDPPMKMQAAISELENLNSNVVRLRLVALSDTPSFTSGTYFMIGVPGRGISRAYSPVSRGADFPEVEFLVRLQDGGAMSGYLKDSAKAGDILEVEGPYGEFKWNKSKNPLVLVAGGTGLAPIISILDSIAAERRHREKILLLFGANNKDDLFYLDELEERKEMMPRLEVRVSIVNSSPNWDGDVGHVTELIQANDIKGNTEAFLCGPPPMIDAAISRLVKLGASNSAIKYERFAASSEVKNEH